MRKIATFLIMLIVPLTVFPSDAEVYEGEVFKASAPVIIAGSLPLEMRVFETPKASLSETSCPLDTIYGELSLTYLKLAINAGILKDSFSVSTSDFIYVKLPGKYIRIQTKAVKLSQEFSSFSRESYAYLKLPVSSPKINTKLESLDFDFLVSRFAAFYTVVFPDIGTEKKGTGRDIFQGKSGSSGGKSLRKPSSHKSVKNAGRKYTLIVVVTTPITHVFNPLSYQTTVILKGNGITRKKDLGKLSGATPEEVIFENIPKGDYILVLKWGDRVYQKHISVPENLHIDFMINF